MYKTGQGFIHLLLACFVLLSVWGCSGSPEPASAYEVIIDHYPEMTDAVLSRNAGNLMPFVSHQNRHVREYAWKAIAMSEADRTDPLLDEVIRRNEPAAWFALSFHALDEDQTERVKQLLLDDPDQYGAACEYFRRQGGAGDLASLISLSEHSAYARQCALAAGTILTREEASSSVRVDIAEAAFRTENPVVRRNLLYGFYRSGLNRPSPDSELYRNLMNKWEESGVGSHPGTDLYMVSILGEQAVVRILSNTGNANYMDDIQMAVEIARNLPVPDSMDDQSHRVVKSFLQHDNPHVAIQALETLKERSFSDDSLDPFIYREISSPTRNHELFVSSLEYLQMQEVDLSGLEKKMAFAEESNPYLTNRFLELYRSIWPADEYLARLENHIDHGGIRGLHATQSLTLFWTEGEGAEHRTKVRRLLQKSVKQGDRSVISGLQALLTDEELMADEDFDWMEAAYIRMAEIGNVENSEQLAGALETRFPDRFVQHHTEPDVNFRVPDWEKLYSLGARPYWQLETNRGVIEIRLDPLSAPFTVSSIDSLTRAGHYDGVAFHRVVRNFVVQGGDFERRDGLGGPGYTLPTEPSLDSYERGSAGIASSGTDTEGSQYFFMHIWAPHLDGSYTRFGKVVRGMDVIDRLQVGDKVEYATVHVR